MNRLLYPLFFLAMSSMPNCPEHDGKQVIKTESNASNDMIVVGSLWKIPA